MGLFMQKIYFPISRKPCPPVGWAPPGAPFLSRQERGKECGLREALTGC